MGFSPSIFDDSIAPSAELTFLGRACDARTGIYETLDRGRREVVVVGKEARNVVARKERDGSVTVSDCGWRTTSTSRAINVALQRWGVPGWAAFANHRLTCFGFTAEPVGMRQIQTINSETGVQ